MGSLDEQSVLISTVDQAYEQLKQVWAQYQPSTERQLLKRLGAGNGESAVGPPDTFLCVHESPGLRLPYSSHQSRIAPTFAKLAAKEG